MSERTAFLKLYRQQEAGFRDWVATYYEAAFYLEYFGRLVGPEHLQEWVQENCPGVDWAVCQDMLNKLHHTPTGKTILSTVKTPEEFKFPA
jgi:hypothetical protein